MKRRKNKSKKIPKRKLNQKKKPVLKELTALAIKLVGVSIVFVSLFTFVFGFHRTNEIGMEPNILPGDFLLYYRLEKKFSIGDTVVYMYNGKEKIARVVAMPKDLVDIDEKGLKVNNSHQYEPKIFTDTLPFEKGVKFPIKLKEDEYFILGDNRTKTTDGRVFGAINKKDILGKIFLIIRSRGI